MKNLCVFCFLFYAFVLPFLCAEKVEDLKSNLLDLNQNIEKTLELAYKHLKSLKAKRKALKTDNKKWRKNINAAVSKEVKEIRQTLKNYNNLYSLNKITENVKGPIDEQTRLKVGAFEVDFLEFREFLLAKHSGFVKQEKEIEKKWNAIQGVEKWLDASSKQLKNDEVIQFQKEFHLISRQVQLQQFNEEEKCRSDGFSGIKQIRSRHAGEKNYFSSTHNGNSFASMHDHTDHIRTVGLGEFVAVLNGVEFRTRHNDYLLKQPSSIDPRYHKTESIEFPDVPPEVLAAGDPDKQILEMREWFKAFHNQDSSKRDYRKYFKPVLCYLEGAWTTKNGESVEEPFESDRHHIDASTWWDLQEKVLFTSYSGTKSRLENLAHLPTTIIDFTEDGDPIYAQWNYRILCHPLKKDLPTKYLKLVTDTTVQKMKNLNTENYRESRSAKFTLEGVKYDGTETNNPQFYSLLDSLMEEIPGKDNYGSEIFDNGFDSRTFSPIGKSKPLNGGYYHRPYRLESKDAMGINTAQRGYSDRFYLALTTQDRVAGPSYTKVEKVGRNETKRVVRVRASYAVPVEIIYLTPLSKWNPYNIEHKDENVKVKGLGTIKDPYTNTVPKMFFRTPQAFFDDIDHDVDPADTAKAGGYYFKSLNQNDPVAVHASGTRVMFPAIKGISARIRQRYPIMPIHGEGSSVWKKMNAIEDSIDFQVATTENDAYYSTGVSHSQNMRIHSHVIILSKSDVEKLKKGKIRQIKVLTERAGSHTHNVIVRYANEKLFLSECDSPSTATDNSLGNIVCWDNHSTDLKTSSVE